MSWLEDGCGLPNGPVLEHSGFVLLSAITPTTSLIQEMNTIIWQKAVIFSPKYQKPLMTSLLFAVVLGIPADPPSISTYPFGSWYFLKGSNHLGAEPRWFYSLETRLQKAPMRLGLRPRSVWDSCKVFSRPKSLHHFWLGCRMLPQGVCVGKDSSTRVIHSTWGSREG